MPKAKLMQSTFNSGILSPQVSQRIDLDKYYRGAQDIRNGMVMPQGGVSKRNGFEKLIEMTTVNDSEIIDKAGKVVFTSGDDVKLMSFKISKSEGYTIIFFGSGYGHVIDNFSDSIFELKEENTFGGEFISALGEQVKNIQYIQLGNSLVYVHPLNKPKIIKRKKDQYGKTYFSHSNLTLFTPTIDVYTKEKEFNSEAVTIGDYKKLSFKKMKNGDKFALCVNKELEVKIITYKVDYIDVTPDTQTGDYIGDDISEMGNNLDRNCSFSGPWKKHWTYVPNFKITKQKVIRKNRQGIQEQIEVNVYKFLSFSLVPTFEEGYNSYANSTGVICIGKSTHEGEVTLVTDFSSMYTDVEKPIEVGAWGSSRGYPATVQSHSGRLVFGGTPNFPQSLFFSRVNDPSDFFTEDKPTAISPIFVTLSTNQLSPITGLISTRKLIVMTTATMHTVQGENDSVITADTINSTVISNNGSRLSQPIDFDSKIFYLQFSGASLNSTRYDYMQDSYTSSQAALLSPSVLVDPLIMDKVVGSNEYNTNYLSVLNSDGTIAYYNSLEEQAINNWTILETDGLFCAMSAFNEDLNVITRRPSGNSTMMLFERMRPDNEYIDSYQRIVGSTSTDKLRMDAYAGKVASVKIDGFPMNLPINDDGTIDLPFTGMEIVFGLPYDLKIVTMPLNAQFESGPILNAKKRVIRANVELLNALDVSLEYENREYDIQNRKMGFDLESPPEPLVGNYTTRFTGWTNKANVAIKSSLPVPATILSIELEVKTGG